MKWFWRIFFTIALLAGWGILGYFFADFTLGSPKRTKPVEVEIPPNSTLQEIGRILKEKRLIREAYFFRYYAAWKNKTTLRAGTFEILPGETLDDMLAKFADGKENKVKVVIPPGWTVYEIADRLEAKGFDKQAFLEALNNKKPQFAFEYKITKGPYRKYKLEGYLYPDTYYFKPNEKPEKIINTMLGQFNDHYEKLNVEEKLQSHPRLKNMTLDKVVTVASLIQREGQDKSELPRIAGVIYNRLDIHMPLQVDAAIVFMYREKGQKVTRVYQKMYKGVRHPYNTYENIGLTPGPISNTTEDALAAALEPENHKFLYYVTREDGTHRHYFATSYEQHQKYNAISKKNREKVQAVQASGE
ncbi:endolytic transglycosylase MltG [Laceyella putida]|uniref:Endolytic murein transglycosylase n=1 Tax=Laceyella putida TaxID=110101 RepID=A0ABW2RKC6_9BACL